MIRLISGHQDRIVQVGFVPDVASVNEFYLLQTLGRSTERNDGCKAILGIPFPDREGTGRGSC